MVESNQVRAQCIGGALGARLDVLVGARRLMIGAWPRVAPTEDCMLGLPWLDRIRTPRSTRLGSLDRSKQRRPSKRCLWDGIGVRSRPKAGLHGSYVPNCRRRNHPWVRRLTDTPFGRAHAEYVFQRRSRRRLIDPNSTDNPGEPPTVDPATGAPLLQQGIILARFAELALKATVKPKHTTEAPLTDGPDHDFVPPKRARGSEAGLPVFRTAV
jgi:hypothetical protein